MFAVSCRLFVVDLEAQSVSRGCRGRLALAKQGDVLRAQGSAYVSRTLPGT